MFPTFALLAPLALAPQCQETHLRAYDGLPGPEGGTLVPHPAFPAGQPPGAILGDAGRVAFAARIEGSARNQGIFVADEQGLRPIAIGCGGDLGSGQGGTCGDPAPTGGTFAGFAHGGWLEPDINVAGDVLFIADLANAPTPRALFLYRAATGAIETVAAVGDPTPLGPFLSGIGAGRVNAHGDVVCLVLLDNGPSSPDFAVLHWSKGVRTYLGAPGLPGPTGPYVRVGNGLSSAQDGIWIPMTPVPAIGDDGRVLFWAAEQNSSGAAGLVVQTPGSAPAWAVRSGDVSHAGLAIFYFLSLSFGPAGEMGFAGRSLFFPGGGPGSTGLFAGTPGNWRTVLGSGAMLGNEPISFDINSLGARWLAPDGSAVVWAQIQVLATPAEPEDAYLIVRPSGALEVLVREGHPHPLGGTVGELFRRPSIDAAGRVAITADVVGGPVERASWVMAPCGAPMAYCTSQISSEHCLPRVGSSGLASETSGAPFYVTVEQVTVGGSALLFYGQAAAALPFLGGTLCVGPPLVRGGALAVQGPSGPCEGSVAFDFAARIQADPSLSAGTQVHAQWLLRDAGAAAGVALSDALSFTIAP